MFPALDRFEPGLVLIASGYDSCAWDSHARLMLHSESYRQLTADLRGVPTGTPSRRPRRDPRGRLRPGVRAVCGLAVLEELSGIRTPVEDPFLPIFEGYCYQETTAAPGGRHRRGRE